MIADAGGRRKRIVSMAFDAVCVRGARLRNACEIRFRSFGARKRGKTNPESFDSTKSPIDNDVSARREPQSVRQVGDGRVQVGGVGVCAVRGLVLVRARSRRTLRNRRRREKVVRRRRARPGRTMPKSTCLYGHDGLFETISPDGAALGSGHCVCEF